MNVQATDSTIAVILDPLEARALLELMTPRVIDPCLLQLESALESFVEGEELER